LIKFTSTSLYRFKPFKIFISMESQTEEAYSRIGQTSDLLTEERDTILDYNTKNQQLCMQIMVNLDSKVLDFSNRGICDMIGVLRGNCHLIDYCSRVSGPNPVAKKDSILLSKHHYQHKVSVCCEHIRGEYTLKIIGELVQFLMAHQR